MGPSQRNTALILVVATSVLAWSWMASAQSPPSPACAQWEIVHGPFVVEKLNAAEREALGVHKVGTVFEEGWEPFAGTISEPVLRRCVRHK